MARLHGEYRHKLDAKGRLSLPAAFRRVLTCESLIVTTSPHDDCLYVFEADQFDVWVDSLFEKEGGFNARKREHVALRKALNARAKDIEADASGRIGLAAQQRSAVGLEKDVVLIGDSDHFEIWDAERWDEFSASIDLSALFV